MKTFRHFFISMILIIAKGLLGLVLLGNIAVAEQKQEIKLGPNCITSECHSDINKAEFLHGPLSAGECEPCHVTVGDRHEFQKLPEGATLCIECHHNCR